MRRMSVRAEWVHTWNMHMQGLTTSHASRPTESEPAEELTSGISIPRP